MSAQFFSWYGLILPWLFFSLLSVVAYGWDKWAALRGMRRVPEVRLHLLALLGGWPGAWLAQYVFRHKTLKAAFRRLFWLTVIGNLGLTLGLVLVIARWP